MDLDSSVTDLDGLVRVSVCTDTALLDMDIAHIHSVNDAGTLRYKNSHKQLWQAIQSR